MHSVLRVYIGQEFGDIYFGDWPSSRQIANLQGSFVGRGLVDMKKSVQMRW